MQKSSKQYYQSTIGQFFGNKVRSVHLFNPLVYLVLLKY